MSMDLRRGISVRPNFLFIRESPAQRTTKSSTTLVTAAFPPRRSKSERPITHLPKTGVVIHPRPLRVTDPLLGLAPRVDRRAQSARANSRGVALVDDPSRLF